jgi:hypothetical protein
MDELSAMSDDQLTGLLKLTNLILAGECPRILKIGDVLPLLKDLERTWFKVLIGGSPEGGSRLWSCAGSDPTGGGPRTRSYERLRHDPSVENKFPS